MQFNQILNPRFSSLLTRYFAIRGAGSPAPTLAPEIAPSIDVNQMDDPAMFYTRNERLATYGATSLAAAAANYTRLQLRNPVGSGTLVIVDSLLANAPSAVFGVITGVVVDDANLQVPYLRDYRWIQTAGVVSPSAIISWGNASPVAPNGGNGRIFTQPANVTSWTPWELVVPPGSSLFLYVSAVNTVLTNSGFKWRERALPNEEIGNG